MLFVVNLNFEFLLFPFYNCYQVSQRNCKFKRLAFSPRCMTFLVKIMRTMVGKSFFTLINVSACPLMLEWSSLFAKETDMFLRAQFQSQTCFKTARPVWVPKHLCPQLYFFSISMQFKLW